MNTISDYTIANLNSFTTNGLLYTDSIMSAALSLKENGFIREEPYRLFKKNNFLKIKNL